MYLFLVGSLTVDFVSMCLVGVLTLVLYLENISVLKLQQGTVWIHRNREWVKYKDDFTMEESLTE